VCVVSEAIEPNGRVRVALGIANFAFMLNRHVNAGYLSLLGLLLKPRSHL
jgi:hypothetical protein